MSELKATRDGYGRGLLELGRENKDVVVLCADLTESTRTNWFEEKYPKRFFHCGVAEQNMVGMAVGLALEGKIPFASTFGVFVPNRAYDQVRISVCYNKANVKLGSSHTGLTVGEDGATHQALEDIAVMRVLPNMTVLVPADYNETMKAVKAAAKITGPVYIRFGRAKTPMFTRGNFKVGKVNVLKDGNDVTIIACGLMVYYSLLAVEKLKKEGLSVRVLNCHTIKPIDKTAIIKAAKETGAVVTAEEHQVNGGLGSAVAEVLGEKYPVPMKRVGVRDSFGESGNPEELLEKYGLTSDDIVKAVRDVVKRKKY